VSGPSEANLGPGPRGPVRRFVESVVDFSTTRPWLVVFAAFAVLALAKVYTTRLELRSDFLELLPRDSPGFIAFEQQLKRVGGGASLFVIAESEERAANERFVDDLAARVTVLRERRAACVRDACGEDVKASGLRDKSMPACAEPCGPELVSYVETGTKEVRRFFEESKWLYADLAELEDADRTLDRQIAIRSGMVSDLESDDDLEDEAGGGPSAAGEEKKAALGMDEHKAKWDRHAAEHDDFPTGYFATTDGTMVGLRIVSPTTGTGDRGGDLLLAEIETMVSELAPSSYQPGMKVGFAGDIPNAIAEKDSIVSEAAWATGIATVLILFGVFAYFRSFSSLIVMLLPTSVGVACAYSFATATFGYVNTSGAFLGAIILGNGINYPLVLLSRYREFVARGMDPAVAKKAAVWNAFRAELVGASVAGIAYGSLVITSFRGFSQFGTIGFVGMLLVWVSIIPLVPAVVTLVERARKRPRVARLVAARDELFDQRPLSFLFARVDETGSRGPFVNAIARATARAPWLFLAGALVLSVIAAWKLPGYLADPWEYNFAKLGSRESKKGGAGEWSVKAEKVFGGKMNVAGAMMLADAPEQTLDVKAQILENDARDPAGPVVADVATVHDFLPGSREEQEAKLVVLERIRDRLTERVLHDMDDDERARLLEMKPPETLGVIEPESLPALLRRRFEEKDGRVGTVFYVKFRNDLSLSNGHNLLRIARTTDNVELPDGRVVKTASRSSIFAEMIRSMERDGPLASMASLAAVSVVVILATASLRGAVCVLASLLLGVLWMIGGAALADVKLNFLNFIALPITFGIGCEYPFNIYDRSRLLGGDVVMAVRRSGGAVALCSYTTIVGYGSLLFADNQALESFGRLAMSGELTTLAAAMLVLPALLHVWKPRRAARSLEGEQLRATPRGAEE
jgi:uncharacterized protein